MPFLIAYLLKFSVSLAVMYLFYQLVLRRLTFYQWNRCYLLGYSLLCFAIPFIHIDGWLGEGGASGSRILTIIPALGQYPAAALPGAGATVTAATAVPVAAAMWGLYDWVGLVLLAGTALMALRLGMLFFSLRRLRRRSVLLADDGRIALYETAEPITPFSFNRSVYFNPGQHSEEELEQIMQHEYVHIQQRHTIDLLVGELLCLLNWYNPFAWLVRYAIRQNLEFIADGKVLEKGVDRKAYQYLLLKVVGVPQYRIANNFNFSNLKKRIIMMNKMQSARLHLARFLFVLPLLGVLLVAFRGAAHPAPVREGKLIATAGIVLDVTTRKALAGARVTETHSGLSTTTDERGYYLLKVPVNNVLPDKKSHVNQYNFVVLAEGYEDGQSGFSRPVDKGPVGNVVQIIAVRPVAPAQKIVMVYLGGYFKPMGKDGKSDREPSYEDAMEGYRAYLKQLDDFEMLGNLNKNNPQVQQFYSTEDKQKQIVFLKNGDIEKYGYPGTPAVSVMESKYGQLPSLFTSQVYPHPYYDKEWQDISARLEREYRPTGNAKKIIFPGDSRVLVQLPGNKVDIFDMDYQQERDKFESLYGKLPGLPPAGRSDNPGDAPAKPSVRVKPFGPNSDTVFLASNETMYAYNKLRPLVQDTTIPKVRIGKIVGLDTTITADHPYWSISRGEPLYVLDGKVVTGLNGINPEDIDSITILKDGKNTAAFGERGKNGVILIKTKKRPRQGGDTLWAKADTVHWSARKGILKLTGKPKLHSNDEVIEAAEIHFNGRQKQLAVDGRLLDMQHDFVLASPAGRMYTLSPLGRAAAKKKYGVDTDDGVLEINSL